MQEVLESGLVAKDQTIIMRVDAETKQRIEAAARDVGLSVTSFITKAATDAASQPARVKPPQYEAGESFRFPHEFAQDCREAHRGGAFGYDRAGTRLASSAITAVERDRAEARFWAEAGQKLGGARKPKKTDDEIEADAPNKPEYAKWEKDLKALRKAFVARDDDAVLDWFDVHYRSAMDLVPARRRNQFLVGVYRALDDSPWAKD